MPFLFENLKVYQKAVDFAEATSNLTETFPRGNHSLADQLNRASMSISLNIAEGNGRFTQKDRNNFFYIARGSAHECIPLLELAKRKSLLKEEAQSTLYNELEQIVKMLSKLIKA